MEERRALDALSALAQPLRLAAFRRMVVSGPEGMAAGDLARELEVPPSTLSSALGLLERAGLVEGTRHGRSIRYAARLDGLRELLDFLIQDCCGGAPELCEPVLEAIERCRG